MSKVYEVGIDLGELGTQTIATFDDMALAMAFLDGYKLADATSNVFIDTVTSDFLETMNSKGGHMTKGGNTSHKYKVYYNSYDSEGDSIDSREIIEVYANSFSEAENIARTTLEEGSRDEEFVILDIKKHVNLGNMTKGGDFLESVFKDTELNGMIEALQQAMYELEFLYNSDVYDRDYIEQTIQQLTKIETILINLQNGTLQY